MIKKKLTLVIIIVVIIIVSIIFYKENTNNTSKSMNINRSIEKTVKYGIIQLEDYLIPSNSILSDKADVQSKFNTIIQNKLNTVGIEKIKNKLEIDSADEIQYSIVLSDRVLQSTKGTIIISLEYNEIKDVYNSNYTGVVKPNEYISLIIYNNALKEKSNDYTVLFSSIGKIGSPY
ncbi:MAG: hypothetical protein ACRDAU_12310 [Clostridium sp.]